ncbi:MULTISPECIES: ATP-binding protein [Pseudomonadota]|uniref:histidine kinase n=1 Tax=Achromobacter insolitus TaxID=217204 RepID=A0A6S7FA04_9BURK|nr:MULTISPECIES: ATP-binding protein [Pseudomonadota]MDQ7279638.1 ATP-binding protein [Stenotrophomonas sp. Sm6012]CAB3938005.1 Adaptive-response sensory-kinase SasA [Achromobacter insolitus]CAB3939076.1 Adaptive-response sensory-kinase SasA [Achromobacter insolitus]
MKLLAAMRLWRRPGSLWWWFGLRMSALAVGTVLVIAVGMWAYFDITDALALRQAPEETRQEIKQLREDPRGNETRLWTLLERYYNIKRLSPGLTNPDWLMLAVMVIISIPIVILLGMWISRPLSRQFVLIAEAARRVSEGHFGNRVSAVVATPGELADLVRNFNDMTMRLQQYEREVRDSSAMLAHELRTPLNAAMGRIQGMMDEVFPMEQDQLGAVLRQLVQINRLVGDLHLVSLARAGQLPLELDSFPLDEVIVERLEWAAADLAQAGIRPVVSNATRIWLYADRDRIGQVLTILIDNVLRYAVRGKVLEIDAYSASSGTVITVADRGPGVAEAYLPNMQDRFWRAETSRARHSGGSGLGLAIAAAVCRAHGGELECGNRSQGGLIVSVHLPDRASG